MLAGPRPVAATAARGPIRIEQVGTDPAFRHLATLPGVAHDLRYAGSRNFAGRSLYGALDCAWLRDEAAAGLVTAAAWLARRRPGWRVVVLDALRPQRVQEAIWRDVVGTPAEPYFADPALGSIHSYGMAVDVTLVDGGGAELDMGSGFDEMTPASHPDCTTGTWPAACSAPRRSTAATGCATPWPPADLPASPPNGGTSITAMPTACAASCRGCTEAGPSRRGFGLQCSVIRSAVVEAGASCRSKRHPRAGSSRASRPTDHT